MLEFIVENRIAGQGILAWIICLAALVWGGGPERAVALVWLLLFKLVDAAYHYFWQASFQPQDVDFFHAANDLVAAVGFIVIALRANRMYVLWIAAFQLITVGSHLARDLATTISPIAYAVMAFFPSYFQLLIFGFGLAFHVKRRKRFGLYRDWLGKPPLMLDRLTPGQTSKSGAVS